MAASCADGTARIFDLRSYNAIGSLARDDKASGGVACTAVQFSASGRVLYASYDDGKVGAWDPFGPGACKHLITASTGEPGPKAKDTRSISSMVLAPDGTALAIAAYDGLVKVWTAA